MHIAWAFIDTRRATVSAIKSFKDMQFIINDTPDEAKVAPRIGELDVLKERYRCALEYMEWFRPAWDTLTEDGRFVLSEYYRDEGCGRDNALDSICRRYCIERTSAYKKKNRALAKLTKLLWGK